MKTIYIGFSSPKNTLMPFAALIKWVEARPYDHAYIRFPDPVSGEYMIFQASKEMVNIYNKDIFSSMNESLKEYTFQCTDEQYLVLWAYIRSNLGIPYSLKEDFGILLMKLFKWKQNPLAQGKSAQFCSELASRVCQILEINIPENPDNIDPTLLDSILSQTTLDVTIKPSF